jgi:acyl-coenzyme A thioesterase PaaI-like protein
MPPRSPIDGTRPAAPGPATIRTEPVRSGRTVATGEARLVQDDREVVRVAARDAEGTLVAQSLQLAVLT